MSRASVDIKAPPQAVRLAKSPFDQMVPVCGKCARKLPGYSAKEIRSRLKAALKDRRWGEVRVVESRCLDLCPKRRQVLASARTLAARRLVVVEPGFDAAAALTQLLGSPSIPAVAAAGEPPTAAPQKDADEAGDARRQD